MFIIFLSIFVLVLTTFENIFLASGFLLIAFILYFVIYKYSKIKFEFKKAIMFLLLAFVISLLAVFVKNYSYSQKINNINNNTWLISQNLDQPNWIYFVWTGIISDIYSYQRFIFEDNDDREYFLNSENKYKIGDIIWLNAYFSTAYTGSKNIFDLESQWNNIGKADFFSGTFNYEFDYPKWMMMKWFYGTLYEQNAVNLTNVPLIKAEKGGLVTLRNNPPTPFYKGGRSKLSFLQKIRKWLQKNIIEAYGENKEAWLILGMLVGDKSQIPPDDYDGFINSGLVHIIAVSGGNIIMIVVFLWAILFFLPFYVRNTVILATIILYAMICGMDSSVFRATIMWWLGMLALFWWREVNIWRVMWIAFISMLMVNPYFLAYDVWFLLSFSAIVGIIYFGRIFVKTPPTIEQPPLQGEACKNNRYTPPLGGEEWKGGVFDKTKNKINIVFKKIAKEYITPTVWATLWVLPVMLFFMGKTNLVWILANFLVVPIVAIVMIYWFISTMLYKLLPWGFFLRPEKILIKYIYIISDRAERFGIYLQAEWAWIKYALIILFVVWLVYERLWEKD